MKHLIFLFLVVLAMVMLVNYKPHAKRNGYPAEYTDKSHVWEKYFENASYVGYQCKKCKETLKVEKEK